MTGRVTRLLQRGLPAGGRTTDLVARTRWLFHLCLVVTLAITCAGAVPGAPAPALVLLAGSAVALTVSWGYRYRHRRAAPWLDGLDVVATLALTLGCPKPEVVFGVTFAAQWFRAVYGRTWHVVAHTLGQGIAVVAAVLLWGLVPGHAASISPVTVAGVIPILFMNVLVARHLALVLFARDQAQRRDAALAVLGARLLGVTEPGEILRLGWLTAEDLCAATPGMRALTVTDEGTGLRVRGTAGSFVRPPAELPAAVLAGLPEQGGPVADAAALDAAAGMTGRWVVLPLPGQPADRLIAGAPSILPEDALTALRSMTNQVALAKRHSEAHRDLAAQALTDALTGLANRAAFSAALAESADDHETWLLFLDLDDFKVVNDGLGHAAGDRLLRHVAERLADAVRQEDLCARLGGDEFAVLLRGATGETAMLTAQRLVELLSAPVVLDDRMLRVGASVGLASGAPSADGMDVVQRADVAMYAAKAAGKNRVQVFTPSLLRVDEAAVLEAELRDAVDAGRLTVVYQPIVAAEDGRCTAVEALVRWPHPTRGLLPPPLFLDAAERTGLIIPLGEFVLRRACADVRAWQAAGHAVAVHVNASPTQLAHPRFVSVVRECLVEYELAPEQLVIEITESSALDSPAARAAIETLAALRVGIAVDDFGTGYSALTLLRTVPIDIVKIDKSFVAGAATEAADQAVLQAIVQMAGNLGLQTVAEGVEELDQQEFVERVGITAVQGYLHLRPVPAGELAAWLGAADRRPLALPGA